MTGICIILAGYMIADAIMFVNGYKSFFFGAVTDQEKKVRRASFKEKGIEWDESR